VKRVMLLSMVIVLLGAGVGFMVALSQEETAAPQAPEELVILAEKVNAQLEAAFQEASFGWIAPNFEDVQASGQRLLNIIAGMNSEDFAPIEGSSDDEIGVQESLSALRDMLSETAWADFAVTADALFTFMGWARTNAKAVLTSANEEEARNLIHQAEAFLRAALGCNEDLPTAGGSKAILTALRGN